MKDSNVRLLSVRAPDGAAEWERTLDLRWRVLRAPWGQPRGSEADDLDSTAVHRIALTTSSQLVGTGRLHLRQPGEAQVRYMAVEPNWRSQGVGSAILAALETEARRLGVRRILLNARVESAGFYRRHGYRTVGAGAVLFGAVAHEVMAKEWPVSGEP